jgi:hypothetical protein
MLSHYACSHQSACQLAEKLVGTLTITVRRLEGSPLRCHHPSISCESLAWRVAIFLLSSIPVSSSVCLLLYRWDTSCDK